jgi:FSR family fosmidomycin resistance protein-like MFS transporter
MRGHHLFPSHPPIQKSNGEKEAEMVNQTTPKKIIILLNMLRVGLPLTYLFLLIEFFDELNYGVGNAALPAIRNDLGISYTQVGLLLGLPAIINTAIEPVLMLLGDTQYRKQIMLAGGIMIALSLAGIAFSHNFLVILFCMVIGYPASGAFVSLSQATLMDLNPGREPQMMARWTVSGSIANLIGPLLLAAGLALGFGWRWAFYGLAVMCLSLVGLTSFRHIPSNHTVGISPRPVQLGKSLITGLWQAIRNSHLMRWLILLEFSDLLLDVLTGYLPLYFTDVAGMSVTQASLMMSILMLVGLISNIVLIPLLEKYPGRNLVRISAGVTGLLFVVWLIAPWLWAKIGLIILIKLVTLGWYEVLQGEAFATLPGYSGTVMATNSLIGLLGGGISFFIGWVAAQAGLPAAMWLLLAGPICLVLFVPKPDPVVRSPQSQN